MFGIVVLEMIPSVRCRSQKSTTSVHKLVIGGESAAKLSPTVWAGCLAARPHPNHIWWSRSRSYLKLTLCNDASQSRCGFKMIDLYVSWRPIDEGSVVFTNFKERNDTINANELNAREVAWTACMTLFNSATDPRKRQRTGKETATSGWRCYAA